MTPVIQSAPAVLPTPAVRVPTTQPVVQQVMDPRFQPRPTIPPQTQAPRAQPSQPVPQPQPQVQPTQQILAPGSGDSSVDQEKVNFKKYILDKMTSNFFF